MKWFKYFTILAFLLVFGVWAWSERHPDLSKIMQNENDIPSIANVEFGRELVLLGNCKICHTDPAGEPYAGGLAIKSEFGTIYTSNITPDAETGIGSWSYDAFERAMRHGVDQSGKHLYPAFPYDRFSRMKEEDIASIYAFLKTEVVPVNYRPPETDLSFPWSVRQGLDGWKFMFQDSSNWIATEGKSIEWNRGAYLAETVGHCGTCHSPRNFLGAEKKGDKAYSGGFSGSWYAPALVGPESSINDVELDNLVNYLLDGWDEHLGVASGPMIKVVNNLYEVNEEDAYSIADYFLDVNKSGEKLLASERLVEKDFWQENYDRLSISGRQGHQIFIQHCASCHKLGGKPSVKGFLAVIRQPVANNLIHVVTEGIRPANGSPDMSMPAKGNILTDEELSDLLTYLRENFSGSPIWENAKQTIFKLKL